MAGKKRWIVENRDHAIQVVQIRSWKFYAAFIESEMLRFPQFIYRGQPSADWVLEPALDRTLRTKGRLRSAGLRARHLENFKFGVRGRRGSNPAPIESENDWWALGQHQGLATPLLDWMSSPYVAAYFAYEEVKHEEGGRCAVYAIDMLEFKERSSEIGRRPSGEARPFVVEFVRPFSDENARLVSQGGLFTRSPNGVHIEEWVRRVFPRDSEDIVFVKMTLPTADRALALKALNRMNINRLSLFPDLAGASQFCNFGLQIEGY